MSGRSADILASLEQRIRDAQTAYQLSMAEYRRLMGIAADTAGPRDPAFIDGHHAMSQALRIQGRARRNYEQALQDFTEYVLSGKLPPHLQPQ